MKSVVPAVLAMMLAACAAPTPVAVVPPAAQQAISANQAAARASQAGQWRIAVNLWQEAARAYAALDDWSGHGRSILGAAQALAATGRNEDAIAILDKLLAAATTPNEQRAEGYFQLAVLWADKADWSRATSNASAAQALMPNPSSLQVAIKNLQARVALGQGDYAATLALVAANLANPLAERAEVANAYRLRGMALRQTKELAAAKEAMTQALVMDRALSRPEAIAADLRALADLAKLLGEPDAAVLSERAAAVCAALPSGRCGRSD